MLERHRQKVCDETIRQATSFNSTCYMPTLQAKFDTSKSQTDPKEDTEKTYPNDGMVSSTIKNCKITNSSWQELYFDTSYAYVASNTRDFQESC